MLHHLGNVAGARRARSILAQTLLASTFRREAAVDVPRSAAATDQGNPLARRRRKSEPCDNYAPFVA